MKKKRARTDEWGMPLDIPHLRLHINTKWNWKYFVVKLYFMSVFILISSWITGTQTPLLLQTPIETPMAVYSEEANPNIDVGINHSMIDIDDFTAAMCRCYSNMANTTPFTEYMTLAEEDSAYPVSYSVMYDMGTGDSLYLGTVSFNSSSYDNGEGGKKSDIDYVRYVLPVSAESGDNSTAMTFFSATCTAIIFAMDEEYYTGEGKEAMEADATIEEIFSIDAKTVNGFRSDSFEIGDYQYAVTLYGPNDSGICRYVIEGGPKDTLFGMFYTQAIIREIADQL